MKHLFKFMMLVCFIYTSSLFAWNSVGHRLIAAIAYEHLTDHAKHSFDQFNHALDAVYEQESFINAAVWLDTLSYQDIHWFDAMHYIDLPFSLDGTRLPPVQRVNALTAIDNASKLLLNKYATDFDKGVALRILLHVIGDIHQPLHAVTRVSVQYPDGDRGGNLVLLKNNPVADNLHAYWDRGAGLFTLRKHFTPIQLIDQSNEIQEKWPCEKLPMIPRPEQWVEEAHSLAIKEVYQLPIDDHYQKNAQKISEKQIATAGCHLAMWLNNLDEQINKTIKRSRYYSYRKHVS